MADNLEDEDLALNTTRLYQHDLPKANKLRESLFSEFGNDQSDDFLDRIKQLESSYGKNTDHKVMESGIHAGTSAIGNFGLMPNTVRDVANKLSSKQTELGSSLPLGSNLADLSAFKSMSDQDITNQLTEDKAKARAFARLLARELSLKQNADEEKMAYSWNRGNNIKTDDITPDKINNNQYVQKFNNLRKILKTANLE